MPIAPRTSPRLHRLLQDVVREVQPRRLSLASPASPVPTTKKVRDVRIQSMSSRKDIIAAVEKCFAEYEADRMAGCIRSLTSSYRGCLGTDGGNTYETHRGVAKNARNGVGDFAVAKSVVDKARLTLARLKAAGDTPRPRV